MRKSRQITNKDCQLTGRPLNFCYRWKVHNVLTRFIVENATVTLRFPARCGSRMPSREEVLRCLPTFLMLGSALRWRQISGQSGLNVASPALEQ